MTLLAPSDETQLAEIVAEAAAASTPLEIQGGGTRAVIGRPVQAEKTLSTAGLSGITLYEPGALTLVVKAGTPMAEVEQTLAAEGQMLGFEPPDHRGLLAIEGTPTIGGTVAVAASGPRRIQKGACRDFMLGVRFVDGQGHVVKNGGRVMKNVTGLDLVKPMAGQFGTLGVLSEIAFKVLPAPKSTATLVFTGLSDTAAVQLMSAALGSPYDVAGAAHLPDTPDTPDGPTTLIRLEGLEQSVIYRTAELTKKLSAHGTPKVSPSIDAWAQVRDVRPFAGTAGAVWRVSLKPTDGPVLTAVLKSKADLKGAFYDWGGGLIWLLVPDEGDASAMAIRTETAVLGGHATLIRASAATRAAVDVFQPEPEPLARISAGLRAKFDPCGILNPGRMG
ncbi:MAG: glycolate oxidase subunit GlcE [Paracoccaceae bacterium]